MTNVAQSYQHLLQILETNPSSSQLDTCLNQLSQAIHAQPYPVCLAMLSYTNQKQLWLSEAAAQLLKQTQIQLLARRRHKGDGLWLLAKPIPNQTKATSKILKLPRDPSYHQAA